jgi:hypothetical protein
VFRYLLILFIALAAVIASNRGSDFNWKHDWPLLGVGVVGLSVLSLDYTSSYEDAQRAVVEWNEEREREFVATHPEAP